jgi:hypothetical protein
MSVRLLLTDAAGAEIAPILATRYEQLRQTFLALIHLVAAWIIIK